MQKARYGTWSELKRDFPNADYVGGAEVTIFDIGGNTYRLVAFVRYSSRTVFVKYVFTHAEYDLWNRRGKP